MANCQPKIILRQPLSLFCCLALRANQVDAQIAGVFAGGGKEAGAIMNITSLSFLSFVSLLLTSCQTQPLQDPMAASYERTRLADDIFEVKCRKLSDNHEKNSDICILNAILWALENGYPYFVELEPEFIETGEGHPEPLISDQWVRITIWGLKENPGVLRFMYDGATVAESISKKYSVDH